MGTLTVGQVVSSAFPFSDLTINKLRPALVVAIGDFNDVILCQITSRTYSSSNPIALETAHFTKGSLQLKNYVRPYKLFTADPFIIGKVYGTLEGSKIEEILAAIRQVFTLSANQ
jgi:mRNA interferase MazF